MSEQLPTVQEVEEKVLSAFGLDDRSLLSTEVRENLNEIIKAAIELAKGVQVVEVRYYKNGDPAEGPVYKKAPDGNMIQYILNQLMGKPKETQAVVGINNNIVVKNEITFTKYAKDEPDGK